MFVSFPVVLATNLFEKFSSHLLFRIHTAATAHGNHKYSICYVVTDRSSATVVNCFTLVQEWHLRRFAMDEMTWKTLKCVVSAWPLFSPCGMPDQRAVCSVNVFFFITRPFYVRTVELCFATDFFIFRSLITEMRQHRQGKLLWIYVV